MPVIGSIYCLIIPPAAASVARPNNKFVGCSPLPISLGIVFAADIWTGASTKLFKSFSNVNCCAAFSLSWVSRSLVELLVKSFISLSVLNVSVFSSKLVDSSSVNTPPDFCHNTFLWSVGEILFSFTYSVKLFFLIFGLLFISVFVKSFI